MKFKSIMAVSGIALVVSACMDARLLDKVSDAQPGSGVNKHLYNQYLTLARPEYSEADTYDTGIFARKAEAAAKGQDVEPFRVWNRDFTKGQLDKLLDERARLLSVLYDRGGRERFPELAATAQTQFDCWVQELEENNQPADIQRCRENYLAAIGDLEERLKPKPVAKKPPAPKPAPAPAPAPQIVRDYLLFFDFDSASLTDDAKAIIRAAAAASRKGAVSFIEATGHADRAGASRYNLDLSERRAAAVLPELDRQGITSNRIVTRYRGEQDPLVQTIDGAREPQNRRVELILK